MSERKNSSDAMQGEGNYDASRRFNQREHEFVKQHGIERQPQMTPAETAKLKAAEAAGKARGKELDHESVDETVFRKGMNHGNGKGHH